MKRFTPFAEVNGLLEAVLSGAQRALGHCFAGMYLHGSLAAGDFDPERSDIDFLVATADPLPADRVAALGAMHAAIATSELAWATNYEGSYIPLQALRRHDPSDSIHPAVRVDGSFGLDHHGNEWIIQRHLIRERGIVLAGPAPQTLVDPISPDQLRQAARGTLRDWWAPQLRDPFRLKNSEYQAYGVLTMCRALYTIECGAVGSKPQAAAWVNGRLGHRWGGLIDAALSWRHGVRLDHLDEVLHFIQYTLERAEGWSKGEGATTNEQRTQT